MNNRETLTELRESIMLKREEENLLIIKHRIDLKIYFIVALAYGLSDVHHQTVKKVLKYLSCVIRISFNKHLSKKLITHHYRLIVAKKKKSPKTVVAFERTSSEVQLGRIFSSLTAKVFHHSVVAGNHVLDFLIPGYTFKVPSMETGITTRLECYGMIIEVDGDIHSKPDKKKQDFQKEVILNRLGIFLHRIDNSDVDSTSTKAIIADIKKATLYSGAKKKLFNRIHLYTLVVCLSDKEFINVFGVSRSKLCSLDYKKLLKESAIVKANDFELPRIVD